jgi:hypothetical protein
MNILKLVGKGTFNGKAAQTGITGTTRRAFSQVISNTSAEVKVRFTLHFSSLLVIGGAKNWKLYSH